MTHAEITRCLALLRAAYPAATIPDATHALHCEMLADLDFAAAKAAILRHVRTNRHFPAISEVCTAVAESSIPGGRLSAEMAWAEVLRQVHKVGMYSRPAFDSPVIQRAVDAVGWREICHSEEGDPAIRAHFYRSFEAARRSAVEYANIGPALAAGSEAPRQLVDGVPSIAASICLHTPRCKSADEHTTRQS
jgi:hypothetical protein